MELKETVSDLQRENQTLRSTVEAQETKIKALQADRPKTSETAPAAEVTTASTAPLPAAAVALSPTHRLDPVISTQEQYDTLIIGDSMVRDMNKDWSVPKWYVYVEALLLMSGNHSPIWMWITLKRYGARRYK